MDALTHALNAVRIRSTVHCPTEAWGEWGISVAVKDCAKFCIVLRGQCLLEAEGHAPLCLQSGDFAVVTRLLPHALRTSSESPLVTLAEFLAAHPKDADGVVRCGTEGRQTILIGGCFYFDDFATSPLLRALPDLLHVTKEQGEAFGMAATIDGILCEATGGRPGAATMLTRLSDILFIQAVRTHFTQLHDEDTNWLRAALDPQIGETLTAIQQDPAHPWKVETLASRVAMSRSAFAARFTQLVGEPPLHHVTRWRIHEAARRLCETNETIAQIAAQAGYGSEAAFSKVFKQWTGQTPTVFRRSDGSPTEDENRIAGSGSVQNRL